MNEIQKNLNKGNYQEVYQELKSRKYCYSIDNFTRDFKKISSEKKFSFLHYVIANEESPALHILICEFLMYTDTFFYDIYSVIKWHLKRALEISPGNTSVLQWIICTFSDFSGSPFSEDELSDYKKILNNYSEIND